MPIVNEDGPAGDTDEFDIPDVPGARSESSKADMPAPSQAETPELKVPELDIPDLDVPAAPSSISPKKESAAHPSEQDVTFEEAPGEVPPPVLIEDDGSLFGDEIPELEEVREPVSRYASEDEVDPDAGGSYSLSGSAPAPRKRKAKKARRKKATIKKTARRRRNQPNAAEGDSSATPDHDSEVDEVQLFDDVLHDDEEDDAGPGASPVMLRRSGTFSTPGKSPGKSGGKAADPVSHTGGKLAKRRPAAREGKSDSNAEGVSRKPVLKRRSSEDRPAASRPKSRPRKKSQPMSPESQRKLMMIGGGGAGLLILIGLFSYLTSGPAVITPTVQSGAANPSSTQSSGPTPVPNQNGDTIQTGDTNSSVARENRIRGAASTPRRIEDPPGGSKIDTGESTVVESGAAETTEPGGTTSSGNETPDSSLPDGSAVVARPLTAPAGPQVALVTEPGSNATSAANGHFQTDDDKLFPVETVPIPAFPNLGTPRASTISGVVFHEIAVGGSARIRKRDEEPLPGSQMDMILYLPSGAHELGSLPCVMIAAAGTTMLEGNGCYDESYQSETIPYVQEGFAVLGYSLDGPLASDKPSKLEKKSAYEQFRAAHAGLVNARNAMEFLVQKVPAINSDRIFTAGHSSAGMLSLLFAEHESRLAGCIAYAPCVDVEKRLSDYISNPLVEVLLPEVDQFVRQGSPQRHFQSLKCPVFLFHAEGDADAPFAESREFAERLAALGTPCHLESVPDGDHYKSMLEEGIPRGIVWLKNTALGESSDSDQPSDPESKNPAIDDPKPSD
jgi:dienelactone hydrolase